MRRMAGNTAIRFYWRMFVNKRPLFIRMALDASRVCTHCKSGLLQLETAVRVVAVAALHRAFQNFVMERQVELMLHFGVTTQAELRLLEFQQSNRCKTRFLRVGCRDKHIRAGQVSSRVHRMRGVTIDTADVVAPVLAAAEVIVLFPA